MIVNCLVNYSGVVKVHVMAKLVCVFRNFRIDKAVDYHKRLFLEAWHSKRDQNAGNEHIEIPDIYVSLA